MSIYKKLFEAKKEIGKLTKDAENPFYKSSYLSLNGLIEAVEEVLVKHDLLLLQPIEDNIVYTFIYDIENENNAVSSGIQLPPLTDPQKLGSAITYYRRYTLQSLLGLQAEDDDANAAVKIKEKEHKREVKTWLSESQYKSALSSDKKGITATISAFTSGTKGMKKEYLTGLKEALKTAKY